MTLSAKRIALLGATSHIAKGLIERFARHAGCRLDLYARSREKARAFVESLSVLPGPEPEIFDDFDSLLSREYDVIINCVGVGTHHKLQGEFHRYFTVTEQFDNLILHYLADCRPQALYISFSSGAVYGRELSAPATDDSRFCTRVNHVQPHDYYAIARLNSEAKHRALADLNIVDLRVFSYFSRHIDLADGYLITDIINCILHDRVLETVAMNIIRDYLHPDDLFSMVHKVISKGRINAAFDVTSAKPVDKLEILDYFTTRYGLVSRVMTDAGASSPTGTKNIYCSASVNASAIGYKPGFTSLESLADEAGYLLRGR